MPRPTHASIGAWALGPTPPALAWGDAFRSIELVGDTTMARSRAEIDAAARTVLREDPISAARRWLAEPARRSTLPERLLEQAERSLAIAEEHLRELDLLAGQVAREANETGVIDGLRLERVDAMAEVMSTYAQRLRTLLEPATASQGHAEERLAAGLDAARAGGGLSALVAAL